MAFSPDRRPPSRTRPGRERSSPPRRHGSLPQSPARPSVTAPVAHRPARQLLGRRSQMVLPQPPPEPPEPHLFPGPRPDDPTEPNPLALPTRRDPAPKNPLAPRLGVHPQESRTSDPHNSLGPRAAAAPPITQAVWASRTAFCGRFASTALEDQALSSEPTVALRVSVRRHRRAHEGSPTLRSIRPMRATAGPTLPVSAVARRDGGGDGPSRQCGAFRGSDGEGPERRRIG
jgi:hypothetical protein